MSRVAQLTEWLETTEGDEATSVLVGTDAVLAREALDRLAPPDRAPADAARRARQQTTTRTARPISSRGSSRERPNPPAAPADVVTQHLVLVLPTTGEFDSRTYRIATTCLARGHTVTVLSRHKGDLPWREDYPAGFTTIRVLATAEDGMPLRRVVRAGRALVRRLESIVTRRPYVPPRFRGPWRQRPHRRRAPPRTGSGGDEGRHGSPGEQAGRVPVFVRGWNGITVGSRPAPVRLDWRERPKVAPRGDIVHGMAFMGLLVALTVAQRDGLLVVYDARDIT